jgi:serine/threonine-protein kinase
MAPERFYGQFSVASDLYAVGMLLYELIVDDHPFSGLPKDVIAAHLNQKPLIPDSVPLVLRSTLERSLQKLPQHRFSSALEMKEGKRDSLSRLTT